MVSLKVVVLSLTDGEDNVVLVTKEGMSITFSEPQSRNEAILQNILGADNE